MKPRFRPIVLCSLGLALVASSVAAKDVYVATNGNDGNTGGSPTSALRTIAAATSKAVAGDRILLMPGRYLEPIRPVRSGQEGAPITYRSVGPDPAVLSHGSVGGLRDAFAISNVAYIVIDGVDIDGVAQRPNARVQHFATINNSRYITIRNGTFKYAHGWHGIGVAGSSDHITIEDNEINWVGSWDDGDGVGKADSGDAIVVRSVDAHHVLIQRNTMRHAGHDLLRVEGKYNIVQDNYLDNSYRDVLGGNKGGRVGDLGGAYNIFQRNYVTGSGASADTPENPMHKIRGEFQIARNNVLAYGIEAGFLSPVRPDDPEPDARQLRVYNNTFYRLGSGAWELRHYSGGTIGDSYFLNNIVEQCRTAPPSSGSDADALFYVQPAGLGPTARSQVRGNLIAPVDGKAPMVNLAGFDGRVSMATAESKYPALFSGNRSSSATFVAANPRAYGDFRQAAGSSAVNAGTFLTKVVGSGRSNQIRVADSRYFTDGYGLIQGDMIQLQGSTERARVVRTDHATNTLYLSQEVEFSDGRGVALAYAGSAPDLGAHETSSESVAAPAPPTALRAE